jgi:hypothetical protein
MKIRLLIIILLFLICACTHHVVLSPAITPNAFVSEKFPHSAAIVFLNELKDYIQHAKPSSYSGSAHTYVFEIGESLCSALTRSVEAAYQNALEPKTNPAKGEYDRIIKFSLQNSDMDVYFDNGFLSRTGRAKYSISIVIEAYDGRNLDLIKKSVVNGNGFSTRETNAFSASKKFAIAVENGIQQIADNVANLLISGYAEPKKENKDKQ